MKTKGQGNFLMFLSVSTLLIILVFATVTFLNPKQIFKSGAAGKCTDTDSGYDPFVKGVILGPNLTTGDNPVDYCIADPDTGELKVVEYGCSDDDGWLYETIVGRLYSNTVKCQDLGIAPACQNGACTYNEVSPDFYCEKDDAGDIYTKGHLLSDATSVYVDDEESYLSDIYDFCTDVSSEYNLIEHTCYRPSAYASVFGSTNAVFSNGVKCPNGCENGACIKDSSYRIRN